MVTTEKNTRRPATRRPTRGGKAMDSALFAELRDSVREGGRILRGQEAARSYTAEEIRAELGVSARSAARLADRNANRAAARRDAEQAPEAAAIRERLGLSQAKFAELLGISRRTLEGWEQGRREPEGPARVLLRVAATHPEALLATRRRSA